MDCWIDGVKYLISQILSYSINLSPNVFIGETFEHMFFWQNLKSQITNKIQCPIFEISKKAALEIVCV